MSSPALRIAAAYAAVALIWILLSDALLFGATDSAGAQWFSIAKGAAFVAATAGALFWVVQRYFTRAARARAETEAEHRKYETLVRSLRDYVFAIDQQGLCTFVTGRAANAEQYHEALAGHPFAGAFGPETAETLDDLVRSVLAGDSVTETLAVIRLPGDDPLGPPRARPYILELSLSPLEDETGAIVGAVGVARDVSRQAAIRRQVLRLERVGTLGTLMAGIAHDFNNFLSVNRLALDLIEPADDRSKRGLDLSRQALDRAAELVGRLLRYARRESPEGRSMVSIAEVAYEAAELFRGGAGRSIEFETHIGDVPPLEGDPVQLEQALMNLLVNARDAVLSRSQAELTARIALTVESIADNEGHRIVRVAVQDNGIGIPPELIDRVFDPFFTTKAAEGTGLGLSSVLGIVREHSGTIHVDSRPGEGARFELDFPVSPAGAAAPAHASVA